jgi:hypothetical protein
LEVGPNEEEEAPELLTSPEHAALFASFDMEFRPL